MKKSVSMLVILILIFTVLPLSSNAAASDFVIDDGVLVSYSGNANTVTIPDEVYYIGDGAFANNKTIASVFIHSNVYYIGNNAFSNATQLKDISGGSSVKYVGANAFYATAYLNSQTGDFIKYNTVLISYKGLSKDIVVPNDITSISGFCFENNISIVSVKMGSKVTEIGEGAFKNCTNLKTVDIDKSVTTIGGSAFENTAWLLNYKSDFVVEGNGILIAYKGKDTNVNIPDSVKVVGINSFAKNVNIDNVSIGKNVYLIGIGAFENCTGLSNVTFGEKTVFIDDYAFLNTSLKEVRLSQNIKAIGSFSFANCSLLKRIIINSNAETIGSSAFANCNSLTVAQISETVKNIDKTSFSNCNDIVFFTPKNSYAADFGLSQNITVCLPKGDANEDGKINIRDATAIQKHIIDIAILSSTKQLSADFDCNGRVNIRDATSIQKTLLI